MSIRTVKYYCFFILCLIATLKLDAKEMNQTDNQRNIKVATFAGGCFWCMEFPFDKVNGVIQTISGYAGGTEESPTYEQVSGNQTSHVEAVQVTYDEDVVSYQALLDIFWVNIDPFDNKGQFCDKGAQYRAKIFTHDSQQQQLAFHSKRQIEQKFKGQTVVTEVKPFTTFYPAEDYHQNYYKNNPIRYKIYRFGCGRDKRLKSIWGKGDEGVHQ